MAADNITPLAIDYYAIDELATLHSILIAISAPFSPLRREAAAAAFR